LATEAELDEIDARVAKELDDACDAAKAAPFPEPEEALTDVYVSY
jgi:pyruvate dehydrogenase E1 component alpha subunit